MKDVRLRAILEPNRQWPQLVASRHRIGSLGFPQFCGHFRRPCPPSRVQRQLTGSQPLGRSVLLAAVTVIFSGAGREAADPGDGHDGSIFDHRRAQAQGHAAQRAIGLVAKHHVDGTGFDRQRLDVVADHLVGHGQARRGVVIGKRLGGGPGGGDGPFGDVGQPHCLDDLLADVFVAIAWNSHQGQDGDDRHNHHQLDQGEATR